jgi:four helix bundle protein
MEERTMLDLGQRLRERSIDLAKQIHQLSKSPGTEDYGLTEEMRRCSIILASQAAESASCAKRSERLSHLNLARRSLFELDIQARVAIKLRVLDAPERLIEEIASIDSLIARQMQLLREQRSRDLPHGLPNPIETAAQANHS